MKQGVRVAALGPLLGIVLWAAAMAPAPERPEGRAFPAAERLFHGDPRWLGGDCAATVALSRGRILWLFGDSFVAREGASGRAGARMVRNTVGLQTGPDPCTASMALCWGRERDGSPTSFFPDLGGRWYWPGCGLRLAGGPLLLFLFEMEATPGRGLGFACAGSALAVVANPDAPPEAWRPRVVPLPPVPFDARPAAAALREGDWVVALAIRQEGRHAGALVRYPAAALAKGDPSGAQWWDGAARGWVPADALGPRGPAFVLDDAGSECSLHWDPQGRCYLHVASYGFGASAIGLRRAPALTGPWSRPVTIYRPPESSGPHPFVYAAKGHPELAAPQGGLLVTYVASSLTFPDLLTPGGSRSLYWPRFVLRMRKDWGQVLK